MTLTISDYVLNFQTLPVSGPPYGWGSRSTRDLDIGDSTQVQQAANTCLGYKIESVGRKNKVDFSASKIKIFMTPTRLRFWSSSH